MNKRPRIGWVLDTSPRRVWQLPWDSLSPVAQIRFGDIACYLHSHSPYCMERYKPWHRYDAVIFVKIMSDPAFVLAEKLKEQGCPVLFDTNVNYYETWGEFAVPGTRPTDIQRHQVFRMTKMADAVVADSSVLFDLCKKINTRCFMVPDAVDTDLYSPKRRGPIAEGKKLTLIWSGIGKKAYHLELIEDVLLNLKNKLHLILVCSHPTKRDVPAPVLQRLRQNLGADITYFAYRSYPKLLGTADVIISPKYIQSSYEQAHTEYKITLGMAVGLPALASPQRSYVEAIGDAKGGMICETPADWKAQIERFQSDPSWLQQQGSAAREKVLKNYSVPVVADKYRQAIESVL